MADDGLSGAGPIVLLRVRSPVFGSFGPCCGTRPKPINNNGWCKNRILTPIFCMIMLDRAQGIASLAAGRGSGRGLAGLRRTELALAQIDFDSARGARARKCGTNPIGVTIAAILPTPSLPSSLEVAPCRPGSSLRRFALPLGARALVCSEEHESLRGSPLRGRERRIAGMDDSGVIEGP